MKRKIIFAVLLLIVVAAGIAAWKYFEKTDDLVSKEPTAKLTATELLAAFDADTAAASRRYVNKILEVTGTVTTLDSSAVALGEDGNPSVVTVGLDERHLDDIKSLNVGDTVTLQGECTGYEKAAGDDLLASLGTTVQLRAAGVKKKY